MEELRGQADCAIHIYVHNDAYYPFIVEGNCRSSGIVPRFLVLHRLSELLFFYT